MIAKNDGVIAQLVEQRTENPCVPGSIPGDTTQEKRPLIDERQSGVFRLLKVKYMTSASLSVFLKSITRRKPTLASCAA